MFNINRTPSRPDKLNKEQIEILIKITNEVMQTELELNKELGNIHKDSSIGILTDSPNGVIIYITLDEPVDNKKQFIEVHKGTLQPCFKDSYTKTLKVIKTPRIISLLSLFSFHVYGEHLNNKILYEDKQTLIENGLRFLLER